jgi:hypothetical protein
MSSRLLLLLLLLLIVLPLPTMESMEKPSFPLEAAAVEASRLAVERAVNVADRMEVGATEQGIRRRGGEEAVWNTDMSSTTVMAT